MADLMDPAKWRRRFVFCKGAYLAVYEFYSPLGERKRSPSTSGTAAAVAGEASSQREVVLLIAGCANSVAVYTMLGDKSLPDYLYHGGFDVWAMDLRGHGEVHKIFPQPEDNNL